MVILLLQEWENFQRAAHPLSCEELSQRTRFGPTGNGPPATLKVIFSAADSGTKGFVTEEDYCYLLRRWWRCTEHWDELLDYSLP